MEITYKGQSAVAGRRQSSVFIEQNILPRATLAEYEGNRSVGVEVGYSSKEEYRRGSLITFASFHDRAFFFLFPRLLPITAYVILRPLHHYTFSSAIYSDSTQGDSPTPTSSRARLGKRPSSGTRRDHPPRAHLLLAAKTPVLRVLALLPLTSSPHFHLDFRSRLSAFELF